MHLGCLRSELDKQEHSVWHVRAPALPTWPNVHCSAFWHRIDSERSSSYSPERRTEWSPSLGTQYMRADLRPPPPSKDRRCLVRRLSGLNWPDHPAERGRKYSSPLVAGLQQL